MDIKSVISYLNEEYGYSIDSAYYSYIEAWKDWWKGYYIPFHRYMENRNGKTFQRKLYRLGMGKKVCEDWASLLLNEKTKISIDDKQSDAFLQGENETDGIFGKTHFWQQENALVEKAFWSGTGMTVLRLENMLVENGRVLSDPETKIILEYLSAENVLPLTVKHGKIVDVAMVSEVLYQGQSYDYVETHILKGDGYHITNQYFKEENGTLKPEQLPPGMVKSYCTGSDVPLFSPMYPNIVKNIDGGSGLGMSILENALDALKGTDLAFNNFCRDFRLGGKKVFYDQTLVRWDENGKAITPDDIMQQLFLQVGDGQSMQDSNKPLTEYNPTLRVEENRIGVQSMLDYLSFKVGLGTKHYQFNNGTIVTAKQYTGDKQELVQNASKHCINIERHIQEIVKAILWAGKFILGEPVNPDAQIQVKFDDGYIIDKEEERERDRQDVRDGVMQKWEYRVKWYDESETDAKAAIDTGFDMNDPFGFNHQKVTGDAAT